MAARPMPKTISSTDASNRFGSVMDEAARGESFFIVTRMGQPRVVVLGVEQYREIMEELETTMELNDEEYMAAIAEAREDIRLGRTLTLEELDRELGFTEEELGKLSR